jgi:N-acetylglucosaminyldiphosphoundecaprenol N-acetyl-beta-D-mannosaminyltransferase
MTSSVHEPARNGSPGCSPLLVSADRRCLGAPRKTATLFGCCVDSLTMEETVQRAEELVLAGVPAQHIALNAAGVVAMRDDARLLRAVQAADLVSADGQSIVWASRLLQRPLPERVAGPDLMLRLVQLAEERHYPIYLLGATQDSLEATCAVLRAAYPRLAIAGARNGYFGEAESDSVVEAIRTSQADILFVAMPTPQREYWVSDNLSGLGVPLCMGVGGAFDVLSGLIGRAPEVMQRMGLEWLHRLYKEPQRMWRRYLIGNLRFSAILLQELRARR